MTICYDEQLVYHIFIFCQFLEEEEMEKKNILLNAKMQLEVFNATTPKVKNWVLSFNCEYIFSFILK